MARSCCQPACTPFCFLWESGTVKVELVLKNGKRSEDGVRVGKEGARRDINLDQKFIQDEEREGHEDTQLEGIFKD